MKYKISQFVFCCRALSSLQRVPNLIGGRFVDSQSFASIDVVNPATEEVVSRVPLSIDEEFKAAAFAAKRALPSWRSTPITTRQRIMFKLQDLIRRDIDKLAMTITAEHGKVLKDAYDEVLRGLEVVENACGLAIVQMGQFTPNISKGIDSYSIREPLGVCAGICPFEFPAMIPLWMFPAAIACGNTFILKPSEQVPGASMMLAELAMEAGLPSGVLNIVHGNNDILNAICDHEDIKAISFVGPTPAGAFVHSRASAHRKRVQSNTGIKNLAVVMPDANMGATLNALVAAGFGGGGQKCAAISTVVFIGSLSPWEDKLLERARQIKVNAGTEEEAELGPVSSKQVAGYNQGNFMGPTILSDVTVNMDCYKEEISGPVLLCMQVCNLNNDHSLDVFFVVMAITIQILLTTLHAQADSIDEAINIINGNKYVSGASIFTISGLIARKFQSEVEVGINAPISDPLPFTSSFGSRPTFTGDVNIDGKAGLIYFYTQMKRVTQQWIGIENTTADGGNSGP
ncbi:hypothetical protein CDL15_Pgr008213 [Punica granatum]|uniref:Aldehyde dehydrogenase domain-containing protein n=1 Tax=Punica granatum TaxID=22663 RepID=A0A218VUC9_PUNGR|nr:hypothetical protein CDL15_Pgr008213 [Punica granatum]